MSEPEFEQEAQPSRGRGRPPRAEVVATQRRRRRGGSLNRMVQFKLDCIPAESLDLETYIYRWVNDEPGKLRMATHLDDYDHVPTAELGDDFDVSTTDSESDERVRMLVGKDGHGNPTYAYLLRKPREFWVEDNEALVHAREDMMAGRVYRGETGDDPTGNEGGVEYGYVPKGADISIGASAQRRKGPIPRRLKA